MKSGSSSNKYFRLVDKREPEPRIASMLGTATKLGNGKIVRTFNLPLRKTCCDEGVDHTPIASAECRACCYASKMVEGRPNVAVRADLNWRIAQREDFHLLLAGAIQCAGVKYVRLHDFGDFFDTSYIETIAQVVRICSNVKFWAYTRAWRASSLVDSLTHLAELANMNLLLSADRETGMPPSIPNTRIAWLAVSDADVPSGSVHVAFRASREKTIDGYSVKKTHLGNALVCPIENGVYSSTDTIKDNYGRTRRKKLGPADCIACEYCMFKGSSSQLNESAAETEAANTIALPVLMGV